MYMNLNQVVDARKYLRWCHGPHIITRGEIKNNLYKARLYILYIDYSSSIAERFDDRRHALVCSGGETQQTDQHYHHILRDCKETETGVVPADDHLNNRRKDKSERGAADRADQRYEETQLWYCLCHDN